MEILKKEGRKKWIFFQKEFSNSHLIMPRNKGSYGGQFHFSHEKQTFQHAVIFTEVPDTHL